MKADLTRSTFDRAKGYSGVLLQQGRVQLDADWNEQIDILHDNDRTARIDEVGPCGAPIEDAGFEVVADGADLELGAGRYYVDGILCENPEETSLTDQPFWIDPDLPTADGLYAVVLDVHERLVTALQDEEIRDVALGGVDHGARRQVVWQARLVRLDEQDRSKVNCVTVHDDPSVVAFTAPSTGWVKVRTVQSPADVDPCTIPAAGGYRGLENQLYRVEVRQGTHALVDGVFQEVSTEPTFVWSRENGSVVTRWLDQPKDRELQVSSLGRDTKLGFGTGDWVELTSDKHELARIPGPLYRIASAEGDRITLDPAAPVPVLADYEGTPRLRRWDDENGERPIRATWTLLEHGISIRFKRSLVYRTGDYWLIPARSITGLVEFDPDTQEPRGPDHHHCVLAIVERTGGTWSVHDDCRELFPAATELTRLSYLGGDGQEAMPGAWLDRPLRAGVSRGRYPVEGETVRFTLASGGGTLEDPDGVTGTTLLVPTVAEGVAYVRWRLPDPPPPDVTLHVIAEWLDADGQPQHQEVHYGANFSVASDVWVDASGCPHLDALEVDTVQEAIDAFCANHALFYVSGDGQAGLPGETLPVPLQVRVGNGGWAVAGAVVELRLDDPAEGALTELSGSDVVSRTPATGDAHTFRLRVGTDGVVGVTWRLGGRPSIPDQSVTAVLLRDDGGTLVETPMHVRFNGTIARARDVHFDGRCKGVAPAKTVADALDRLCANHALHYVGGDGQHGRPGKVLPMSLRVRVAHGRWPTKGALVRFEVLNQESWGHDLTLAEAGRVKGRNPVAWGRGRGGEWSDKYVVRTDATGLAQAQWWLGTESRLHAQRVRATLLDERGDDTDLFVLFNASVAASDPKVSVVLDDGREVAAPPGAVLPLASFAGLKFHDLLVKLPPATTPEVDWWPGVRITVQQVVGLAGQELVLPGLSVPEPGGALVWWYKPPPTNVTLDLGMLRDFSGLRSGGAPGPFGVADLDLDEASFAGSLDDALRQPLALESGPLRRAGDRIVPRERLPPGELEVAAPSAEPGRGLTTRRLLLRVQLRPSTFPDLCAARAADFETFYWIDPEAKYASAGG